jgi:hypothetical protein
MGGSAATASAAMAKIMASASVSDKALRKDFFIKYSLLKKLINLAADKQNLFYRPSFKHNFTQQHK